METREDILKGIFGRVSYLTGKDEASLDESTTFESLNLKSVNYSQITTYLEDELDVEVPYMGFRKNKTIERQLTTYLGCSINRERCRHQDESRVDILDHSRISVLMNDMDDPFWSRTFSPAEHIEAAARKTNLVTTAAALQPKRQ